MALIDNILAYYKLDEASGNATDATGNGKTLTNNNTVGFAAGLINNGADFGTANTNKYFKRSGYVGTDGAISFSFWVKMRTEIASGTQTFFHNVTESTELRMTYDYNGGSRTLSLIRSKNAVSTVVKSKTITLGTSNWYHIVGTYSGSNINFYVNNVAEIQSATSGNGTSNWSPGGGFTTIGVSVDANSGAVGEYASAYVDEVGIWQKELSASEVSQLYSGGTGNQYSFYNVVTNAVTAISTITATGNGNVVYDGGATITERGIVWATTPSPTTANGKASTSGTTGVYSVSMTGLAINTLYYVRAYYINSLGTSYGIQLTFTTLNINQYELQKDIGATTGNTFIGQINVTGTLGTVTVKLGTTGTATVIAAGAGVSSFSGTYSGLSGLIITRSADFNGTIDNVYYTALPLGTTVDFSLDSVTIVTAVNSSVFFKRIEDDVFNSFRFYRYLDLLFKDLDGYVTVTVRDEREDITTERSKVFSVGNTGTGTVSPFQKKRVSFLIKNQAVIIGLSNGNIGETFSIAQFILTGHKKPQRTFAPSKIQSL